MFRLYLAHSFSEHPPPTIVEHSILKAYNDTVLRKAWLPLSLQPNRGASLFNLYAEYIMRNAGLEEIQAGIKIARKNINNLRYADDTTLMAESEDN